MEYILANAVAALLDCDNVSLLGIQRMLSDGQYRAWVVKQIKDPMTRSFWTNEFERYTRSFQQEAVAPIQNKVGQLLMSPHLRNILGQIRSRIDARFMMDDGRIFIADVSKGKLGADKANLLGALLVTQFQLAAMSRSNVPEVERRDFFLYHNERYVAWLQAELPELFPDEKVAEQFYKDIRCGSVHEGRVKNGCVFDFVPDRPITVKDGIMAVNPEHLIAPVANALVRFCKATVADAKRLAMFQQKLKADFQRELR